MSAATKARSARNRANASHSTGPKTIKGKARSSRNALVHGIFSKELLLPGEDPAPLDQFKRDMIKSLAPRNAMELELVEQVIADRWRVKRVRAAEQDCYEQRIKEDQDHHENECEIKYPSFETLLDPDDLEKKRHPRGHLARIMEQARENEELRPSFARPTAGRLLSELIADDIDPSLEKLHRYEQRLNNSVHRCMIQLRQLQRVPVPETNEFTQALLGQEDAVEQANVQNEARTEKDECGMMKDELKTDPVHHSSFNVHHSQPSLEPSPDVIIESKRCPDV